MQAIAFGVVVLGDRRPEPLVPRWVAYASFWAALSFLPGALCPLTTTGPLAWDGVLAWWLGLSVFGVWIGVVTWALLHARRTIQ